jgi:hypothetical protein
MPEKASRETGGRSARKGLRARTASAWEANADVHTAVSPASIRGSSGKAGAG